MNAKQYIEISSQEDLKEFIQNCTKEHTQEILKHNNEDYDTLLTTDQCCELLQISRTTLWKQIKNGVIPKIRIGNTLRFEKKEVIKALKTNSKLNDHDRQL